MPLVSYAFCRPWLYVTTSLGPVLTPSFNRWYGITGLFAMVVLGMAYLIWPQQFLRIHARVFSFGLIKDADSKKYPEQRWLAAIVLAFALLMLGILIFSAN